LVSGATAARVVKGEDDTGSDGMRGAESRRRSRGGRTTSIGNAASARSTLVDDDGRRVDAGGERPSLRERMGRS
jgi:hypothetical protein